MGCRTARGRTRAALVVSTALLLVAAAVPGSSALADEVLGGAPQTTAAPPAQDAPELGLPDILDGLQYGDPAAGLDFVEPPEVDAFGDAQLRHPIQVPRGRLDWQPGLAFAYNSGAGNGWMGQGWDLSLDAIRVPGLASDVSADAISVDTRWGVPRYDPDKESESYSFGGEQLSPNAHRREQLDREAERRFTKRVEGDFLRIVRHGDSPGTYWWEVHDKLGNKYFYGGELTDDRPDDDGANGRQVESAVLKDEQGHAYWWGLREKWDISSNVVTYFYEQSKDTGIGGGSQEGAPEGTQLYLDRINYTGSRLHPKIVGAETPLPRYGAYDVTFTRDSDLHEGRRPDVAMDATNGALKVTAELLRRVDIRYCPGRQSRTSDTCATPAKLVRRYVLDYERGAFGKTLLRSIGKAGTDGWVYATHELEYFDDVRRDGRYEGFGPSETWESVDDDVSDDLLGRDTSSALGTATSLGGDGRMYLGFNPISGDKSVSVGGGFQLAGADSETRLESLDINGDGLPDKVFLHDGGVGYRLNQSTTNPDQPFAQGAPTDATGLPSLGAGSEFSVGISAEAYVFASVMFAKTWTFSREHTYFSDVNADGLPDLVNGGQVLFNHRDEETGRISFSATSAGTEVPIDQGNVHADVAPDLSDVGDEQESVFPRQDTLRRWVAPWTGRVRITAPVDLRGDSVDGVRVAIQRNGDELWGETLASDDRSVHTPAGLDDVAVTRGDRIYFRLQPLDDGAGDRVAWDPVIQYTDRGAHHDVNGLDEHRYDASADFTLAGRPGTFVALPFDGRVRVHGVFRKTRATSDDIRVLIERDGVPVFEQLVPAATVGELPVDQEFAVEGAQGGGTADKIAVRMAVDSPIDVNAVEWKPALAYVSGTGADGRPLPDPGAIRMSPPPSIDIYPLSDVASPVEAGDYDDGGQHSVLAKLTAVDVPEDALPSRVVFTVKRRNGLLAKRIFTVTHQHQVLEDAVEFHSDAGEDVWFDFTFDDPRVAARVTSDAGGPPPNHGRHWTGVSVDPEHPDVFPAPYRAWAYGGYNGDGPRQTQPVAEDDLRLNRSDFPGDQQEPESLDDPSFPNPVKGKGYVYAPAAEKGYWRGPKDPDNQVAKGAIWGGPGEMSTSRLGPDSPGVPSGSELVPAGATAPAIVGRGDTDAFGASALGLAGAGVGFGRSRGTLDFLDLNGDAYPDVVGKGVQYTDQVGRLSEPENPSGLGANVRFDHQFSHEFSGEGTPAAVEAPSSGDSDTPQQAGRPSAPADRAGSGGSGSSPTAGGHRGGTGGGGGAGGAGGGPGGKGGAAGGPGAGGGGGGGDGASGGKRGRKANKGGGGGDGDGGMDVGADLGLNGSLGEGITNDRDVPYPPDLVDGDGSIEDDLADLNGDGLPDRVVIFDDGRMEVRWNLGYRFTAPAEYPSGQSLEEGRNDSKSIGIGLGFNVGPAAFSGGASLTLDSERTDTTWEDLNGDGLADRLDRHGDDNVTVAFNTGAGVAAPVEFGRFQQNRIGESESTSLGGGADFTIGIGPLCWPTKFCYIILNPGAHVTRGNNASTVGLEDVDGDGFPDSVASDDDRQMEVRRNRTGRTNLLRSVRRPLGATIELDYDRVGNTTLQPQSKVVLERVEVTDGHPGDGADRAVTTYEYGDARFSFAEREDLGFDRVVEKQHDNGAVVRSYERRYRNATFYERGLLARETLFEGDPDAGGDPRTATVNSYDFVDGATGDPANLDSLTASVFPRLIRTEKRWYDDAGDVAKRSDLRFAHDVRGNVVQVTDLGEPDLPQDDVVADMTITDCSDTDTAFPWTQVADELVIRSGGEVLQRREADVACDSAAPSRVRDFLDPDSDDPEKVAVTDVAWVTVGGQVSDVIGPGPAPASDDDIGVDDADGRYRVTYEYDELGVVPVRTSDSHGLASTTEYDPIASEVAATTDANGARTSFTFDARGRMTTVKGPFEQGTGNDTISFEYHLADAVPWAMARHRDPAHPDDPVDTVRFVDGLSREIQTKSDATLFQGDDQDAADRVVVSGAVRFDALGRIVREWQPTTEPKGTPGQFNATTDPVAPTQTSYSVLDRVTETVEPGDRRTTFEHGFASGPFATTMFTELETDPTGSRTRVYTDVRDEIVAEERLHRTPAGADRPLLTRYDHDALARLVKVTDATGAATSIDYDLLGRRTSVDEPDTGKVEFLYDLAGNLTGKVTPNLRGAGQRVAYDYDRRRLTRVRYLSNPSRNVAYTYGGPGAPGNATGLVSRVEDGGRTQTRSFDVLGRRTAETSTIKGYTGRRTYTTRFDLDGWGRPRSMTYPDGEVVTYGYDAGGLPRSAAGSKGDHDYAYVDRLEYDKFGNRRFLAYGNGLRTRTSYDPETTWMSDQLVRSGTAVLQDLHLRYDDAGNLVERDDVRPRALDGLKGGPSNQSFTYDDRHRLVAAEGEYLDTTRKVSDFELLREFDDAGRLVRKKQTHRFKGGVQPQTTYDKRYVYGLAQPHAPSNIGQRTHRWDSNGNLLGWKEDFGTKRREVTWDEENRPATIADNRTVTSFKYDDEGAMTAEYGQWGEIDHPNPYYRSRAGIGFKDVLIGDLRVATQRRVTGGSREVPMFLTSDLTESTTLVTNPVGGVYSHVQYFPSGDHFVNERNPSDFFLDDQPWWFTGQHLDESFGLSLLGARWYEPRDDLMLSADPILTGDVDAVKEDPELLDAYTYAFDNPASNVDDSGARTESAQSQHRSTVGSGGLQARPWLAATPAAAQPAVRSARDTFSKRLRAVSDSKGFKTAKKILSLEVPALFTLQADFSGGFHLGVKVAGIKLRRPKLLRR